jgi:hypothetical protein
MSKNSSRRPSTSTRSHSRPGSASNNTFFQLPTNFSEYAKSTSTNTTRITMADIQHPTVTITPSPVINPNINNPIQPQVTTATTTSTTAAATDNINNVNNTNSNDLFNMFQQLLQQNNQAMLQTMRQELSQLKLSQDESKITSPEEKDTPVTISNNNNSVNSKAVNQITQYNHSTTTTKCKQPSFNGDLKDYAKFRRKFKNFMKNGNIPANQTTARLLECLEGEAEEWFNTQIENDADIEDITDVDELFRDIMDPKYDNKELQDSFKNKYESLRWTYNGDKPDTVESFVKKVDELAASSRLNLDDGAKKRRFKRTCPGYMRDNLEIAVMQSSMNYLQFVELAKHLENNYIEKANRNFNKPREQQQRKKLQQLQMLQTETNDDDDEQQHPRSSEGQPNPKIQTFTPKKPVTMYCKVCKAQGQHWTDKCPKLDIILKHASELDLDKLLMNQNNSTANNAQTNIQQPKTKLQALTIQNTNVNKSIITLNERIKCTYLLGLLNNFPICNILADSGAIPNITTVKCLMAISKFIGEDLLAKINKDPSQLPEVEQADHTRINILGSIKLSLSLMDSKSNRYVPIAKDHQIEFLVTDNEINDVIIGKQLLIPAGMSEVRDKSQQDSECVAYNPNENEPSVIIHPNSYVFKSVDPSRLRMLKFKRNVTIPAKSERNVKKLLQLETKLSSDEIKCLEACNLIPHLSSDIQLQDQVHLMNAVYSLNQIKRSFSGTIINNSDHEVTIKESDMLGALEFIPADTVQSLEPIIEKEVKLRLQQFKVANTTTEECIQHEKADDIKLPEYMNKIEINPELPENDKIQLKLLLLEYQDVFHDGVSPSPLLSTNVTHEIDTGEARPMRSRLYPQSKYDQDVVRNQIEKWLKNDYIEESQSNWSAAILTVPKKDGGHRVCGDYRKLNSVTKRDCYPVPNLESQKQYFIGSKYFSQIDFTDAYNQILLKPEDREKTAIVTHFGLFHFKRLPFGLCNAPASFLRVVDRAFKDCIRKFVMPYFDDITIYSQLYSDHLHHLKHVFDIMREMKFRAKPSKCRFGYPEITWMAFILNSEGIKPDPTLINKIMSAEIPKTVKQLQSFLALCNYYRAHIKNFSAKTVCLYELTKSENVNNFIWKTEHQQAFELLKLELSQYPVVRLPDYDKPFHISTDASDYAIGGILQQRDENNHEYVVSYFSRKLSKSELKHSPFEKEALAVRDTVAKFDHYLRHAPFMIYTDHLSLTHLKKFTDLRDKLSRLAIHLLSNYEFDIQHKPGIKNGNADALSRLDFKDDKIEESEDNEEVKVSNKISVHNLQVHDTKTSLIPLAQAQKQDTLLLALYNYVKSRENQRKLPEDPIEREFIEYYTTTTATLNGEVLITNDCLYRKIIYRNDQSIRGEEKQVYQLLIPNDPFLRNSLLSSCHLIAGHCGQDKLKQIMKHRYYWRNIDQDITQFVQSCHICQITKSDSPHNMHSKQAIISQGKEDVKFLEPFSQICIDHIVLPKIKNCPYKYILCVIDRYSRFAQAYPVESMTAEETADILIYKWMFKFGFPRSILHDNGTGFMSELMVKVNEIFDVKSIHSSSYNPQSHGMVEKFNQSLEKILRSLFEQYGEYYRNYHLLIDQALFAYNYTPHKSTGYSPFKLAFGRDIKAPIDRILFEDSVYESIDSYLTDVANEFRITHAIVLEHLMKQQERYEQYNLKHKDRIVEFNIGDQVLLAKPEKYPFKKLSPNWYEIPFVIKDKFSDTSFYIEPLEAYSTPSLKKKKKKVGYQPMVTNSRRLKLYTPNAINQEAQAANELIDSTLNDFLNTIPTRLSQPQPRIPDEL